jgi:hypothetical protein
MKLVAWRLPQATIDKVKAVCVPFNMPYQAFMRLLLAQGLQYLDEHGALDIACETPDSKALEAHRRAAFVAAHKAANNIPDEAPPPRKHKPYKRKVPSEGPPVSTTPSEDLAVERGVDEDVDYVLSGQVDLLVLEVTSVSTMQALSPDEEAAGVSTSDLEEGAALVDTKPSVAQQIMEGLNSYTHATTPAPPPDVSLPEDDKLQYAPGYEPPPLTPEDIEEQTEAVEQATKDAHEEAQQPSEEGASMGISHEPQQEPPPIDPEAPYLIEPSVMESRSPVKNGVLTWGDSHQPLNTHEPALPTPIDTDDDEFAKLMESIPEPKTRDTEVPPPIEQHEETKAPEVEAHELLALLEGDSIVQAESTHVAAPSKSDSDEDDIMDVLDQFNSPANRVAASADDERPAINNSHDVSADDFASILGQL